MDLCATQAFSPRTLTFITTYRCTAACVQCCFESSPTVKGRLSRDEMIAALHDARDSFPSLSVVVFTGGEATLLKDDLISVIAEATSIGLVTRMVSNGSWAKTKASGRRWVDKLVAAGLRELNISSGKDHQEWVPHASVVNAAEAALEAGLYVLVTVEADTEDGRTLAAFSEDPTVRTLLKKGLQLQSNSWMEFKSNQPKRENSVPQHLRAAPCQQVHDNIVITPYKEVAACCGLTLEHIPEMKLGRLENGVSKSYLSQANDFLKYWIKVDGPAEIIRRVMGQDKADELLQGSVHMCHDCAVLHKNSEVRARLEADYQQFVPEVMSRHALSKAVDTLSRQQGTFK